MSLNKKDSPCGNDLSFNNYTGKISRADAQEEPSLFLLIITPLRGRGRPVSASPEYLHTRVTYITPPVSQILAIFFNNFGTRNKNRLFYAFLI